MFEMKIQVAITTTMMTNLRETALQSPVMTIRHVSGAGMNCLFAALSLSSDSFLKRLKAASV
jgi:hypothetical protein